MEIFAGWAYLVVRKNKHRWASFVYAGMLLVAAGVCVAVAVKFPQIHRKFD